MTKLASTLPDGHGLDAVRHILLHDPRHRHVGIVILNTTKINEDLDKGEKEPVAAIRTIEIAHPDDLQLAHKILTRGRDKRLGATVLPLDIEDDVADAFTGRSEDIGSDIGDAATHLDPDQAKALAASLGSPLRSELTAAIRELRNSKDWVTLGRARRVLQVVITRLEDNDKRLLRDAEGRIVDPDTGEVVDEDTLTSEDIDRMLQAMIDDEPDEPDTA